MRASGPNWPKSSPAVALLGCWLSILSLASCQAAVAEPEPEVGVDLELKGPRAIQRWAGCCSWHGRNSSLLRSLEEQANMTRTEVASDVQVATQLNLKRRQEEPTRQAAEKHYRNRRRRRRRRRQAEFFGAVARDTDEQRKQKVAPTPVDMSSQHAPPGETRLVARSETPAGGDKRQRRLASGASNKTTSTAMGLVGERVAIACGELAASEPPASWPQTQTQVQARTRSSVSLAVWHKDDQLDAPIFSVDARGVRALHEAKQQTLVEWLKGRARLEAAADGKTPALVIERAEKHDAGLYTCHLELAKAPTQTHQVRLTLAEPPGEMTIRANQLQLEPPGGPIGPYDERSHLRLVCELGQVGEPPVQLAWWRLHSLGSTSENFLDDGRTSTMEEERLITYSNPREEEVQLLDGPIETQLLKPAHQLFLSLQSSSSLSKLRLADQRRVRVWVRAKGQTMEKLVSGGSARLQTSLDLTSLERHHLGEELLCLGHNQLTLNLAAPLNASIRINMNLQPLEVRIVNKSQVLRLNQRTTVECQVWGSRPPAKISWSRAGQPILISNSNSNLNAVLKPNPDYAEQQANVSELQRDIMGNGSQVARISHLTFTPQLSDNQQSLSCSAHNPRLGQAQVNLSPLSDSFLMNVQYPPRASLRFGQGIRLDSIKLGSDVFMDCLVRANPPLDEVATWLLDDKPLTPDPDRGIIMSNMSLAIQRMGHHHRGQYQCAVMNQLGRSLSNKLQLQPKFEPVCDYAKTRRKYEIPVGQATRIECNVLAEPSQDLQFEWRFNQSLSGTGEELEELKQFETNYTKSEIMFKPKSKLHYGQLLCWASNSMGRQEKACTIQVVASELPEPVFGCFFDSITPTSFSLHCQSNKDSSLGRLSYLLELNEPNLATSSQATPRNTTPNEAEEEEEEENVDVTTVTNSKPRRHNLRQLLSDSPTFKVDNLRPNSEYNVAIYAQNSKGRSAPAYYSTSTAALEPQPSSSQEFGENSSGQVQLNSGRLRNGSEREVAQWSLSERLFAYLKMGDLKMAPGNPDADQWRPLIGLALILLLSTITLLTLAFFATRLCRAGTSAKGPGKRRRISNEHKQQPLALATPSRLEGLAGNGGGSDSSRETNTDSTLVSATAIKLASNSNLNSHSNKNELLLDASTTLGRGRLNHQFGRLSHQHLAGVGSMSQLYGQQQRLNNSNYATMRRHRLQLSDVSPNGGFTDFPNDTNQNSINNTPQVSLQSAAGSDCTSSQHEPLELEQPHRQLLLSCQNFSEPLYVINPGQQQEHQICLINHHQQPAFWSPYSDPLAAGYSASNATQVTSSSLATGDSFDLQTTPVTLDSSLVGGALINSAGQLNPAGGHHLSILANSASIPVSLADYSHLLAESQRRGCLSPHSFAAD